MAGKVTVTLVGRLARDPDMRFTPEGTAVCSFSIPVQERKDGETVWYKVTAWDKQAEVINQYATKGTWLMITGTPKVETWEDKNSGETRVQLAVTVRDFTFCGGGAQSNDNAPPQEDAAPAPPQRPARPAPPAGVRENGNRAPAARAGRNVPQAVDDVSDEDLPF